MNNTDRLVAEIKQLYRGDHYDTLYEDNKYKIIYFPEIDPFSILLDGVDLPNYFIICKLTNRVESGVSAYQHVEMLIKQLNKDNKSKDVEELDEVSPFALN